MPTDPETLAQSRAQAQPSGLPFPLVGIGASAGGLQAVKAFLGHMPTAPGMAFVVVLHLSPHHQSIADKILQEATGMPVSQVTGRVLIEVDHVYVIAPAQHLVMTDGHLDVTQPPPRRGGHVAIDLLFRDLAEAHRERAICVILSGSGTDGAVGLTRIKEGGGITLVQALDDAEYDGMPRAAIETGAVDFVLPVVDMPEKILQLWGNARQIELPPVTEASEQAAAGSLQRDVGSDEHFIQDILLQLRSATGHDFRHYKRATVLRRIERRLQVTAQPNLEAYYNFFQEHAEEPRALLGDMLIGVTNFFRDREAFEALERDVLPEIVRASATRQPTEELRIWSAGCSTGEEAYSLTMLVADLMEVERHPGKLQAFATDIDERAIIVARGAVYPEAIATDVPPAQLRQHFVKETNRYRVRKEIRERILFANHSLLADPPFSQIDLIACRNLLIYLNREIQREILQTLHFALRPGGYLFLGTSESADACPDLFAPVDKKNRIFRARPVSGAMRRAASLPRAAYNRASPALAAPGVVSRKQVFKDIHRRAVERYAPPSMIVDGNGEILHMTEGVGGYLRHVAGEPSRSLLTLIVPELRLEMRTSLFQAQQNNQAVISRAVRLNPGGEGRLVQIAIEPYRDDATDGDYLFIAFRHTEVIEDDFHLATDYADSAVINNLERELQRTKTQLQETIEQSEVSSEELKASNEEMQAVNEELRSATEELETSKEELQSINEELLTVNHELKIKVEETDKVNDYLTNLIASTDIATVFIDRGMRIKWFTPRATEIFSMIPMDTGRSLLDITHRLHYDTLAEDAEAVFQTLSLIEREVSSSDGHWYIARLLPYRSSENHIHGTVLTFIDITKRRAIEQQFRAGEERLRLVAESTRDYAIFILDENGVVTDWYKGAEMMFGYARDEAEGRYYDFIFTQEDRASGAPEKELTEARTFGRGEDERWHLRKDGTRMYCSGEVTQLRNDNLRGFVKIAKDLTGQQQLTVAQTQMLLETRQRNQLKDEFFAVMSHELKHPLNLIQLNTDLLYRIPGAIASPPVARAVDTIRDAVKGQARIIDDLLDVARVETGKLNLDCKPLDLCQVLRDIHHLITQTADTRAVSLECPPEPLMVSADITRLEQIIWNLVSNALKFTDDSGVISLVLARAEDQAVLQVSDNGAGIELASQGRIFDLFGQAVRRHNWRERQGLGIGLSLVSQLSVALGGTVAVASDGPGHGATFTVTLPLLQDQSAAVEPATPAPASLQGLRVLLVDDSPDVLDVMRDLLEMEEAVVQAFQDPARALEWARSAEVDALVSDVGMPGMTGHQLLQALRGLPGWKATVAIALTGYGEAQDLAAATPDGFSYRFGKPVAFDQLLALLASIRQACP